MENKLKVEYFAIGSYSCNCTIIHSPQTMEAIVIDPGNDPKALLAKLSQLKVKPVLFLHTHAHFDHIGGAKELREKTGGKVCLHKDDHKLYLALPLQSVMFGQAPMLPGPIDHFISDNEEFGFENGTDPTLSNFIKSLHTPGHTEGSCCFFTDVLDRPLLMAGDTLFQGSIGRTDLPGGDFPTIKKSIKERLYSLPKDTLVIPGHGPNTTIADEGRSNAFVKF